MNTIQINDIYIPNEIPHIPYSLKLPHKIQQWVLQRTKIL
jgi:hypothetical protein